MSTQTKDLIRDKRNFIKFTPEGITWGYHAHYIIEPDGLFSWYIPSFDIYFTSTSEKEGDQIGMDATEAFFDFWLKKQGFRKLISKILRLGYKANNFQELHNLLQRKSIRANLTGINRKLPASFAGSESRELHGKMEAIV